MCGLKQVTGQMVAAGVERRQVRRVEVEMFITRDDYNKENFTNDLAILR